MCGIGRGVLCRKEYGMSETDLDGEISDEELSSLLESSIREITEGGDSIETSFLVR